MSCIPNIHIHRWEQEGGALPRHIPPWTDTKAKRLWDMAFSVDPRVRSIAANHPKTVDAIRRMLSMDEDKMVRTAAIKNSRATPEDMMRATSDVDAGIRAFAKMLLLKEQHA